MTRIIYLFDSKTSYCQQNWWDAPDHVVSVAPNPTMSEWDST